MSSCWPLSVLTNWLEEETGDEPELKDCFFHYVKCVGVTEDNVVSADAIGKARLGKERKI